jgi:hypothetical protein
VGKHVLAVREDSVPIANSRGKLIERLTTPRRLLLTFGIIVFVAFAAQMREVAQREGAFFRGSDVPVGADFYAFYSAGKILLGGDGPQLYDLARQQAEQERTLDSDTYEGFVPFPYPAFFAAPYALIARLPFLWAYFFTSALMLVAAIAAVWLLRPVSPLAHRQPYLVVLGLLASQPLSATIYGGQTVAFSLICYAGCCASLRKGHDAFAGVWLGLLLYKPQLALPLLLLLLWRARWRAVGTAVALGFGLALVGVAVAGVNWPLRFMDLASGAYYSIEADVNGANMISLLGVAEQVFGPKSALAYGIAGALGIACGALLLLAWRGAKPDGSQFPLQFGLAIAVTLMISPHAMFYEASLLILPIIFLIDAKTEKSQRDEGPGITPSLRYASICFFILGYFWPLGSLVGIQLLAVLPIVVALLIWRELRLDLRLKPRLDGWRLSLGVPWGESPNAPSGKRS